MDVDHRVASRYDLTDESERLWRPGRGDLIRLRTWDIFRRFLPPSGRILDVGGGPGTHAEHLAGLGYDVTLVDPIARHIDQAAAQSRSARRPFEVRPGVAGDLPIDGQSIDAVLLMGPLYHLVESADRQAALAEARRVLRPGGRLLAEVICRHAWLLDASIKGSFESSDVWANLERSVLTGLTHDPSDVEEGAFWAIFHHPEDLQTELTDAGFGDVELVAVEGYAWLLGDLEERMKRPEALLRAIQLTETEPSMLGCSAHLIGVASLPS